MSMVSESQAVLQAPDQQGVGIHGSQGRQWWRGPVVGPCLHITQQVSMSTQVMKVSVHFMAASFENTCSNIISTELAVAFTWKANVHSSMMLSMRSLTPALC